MLRITCAGVRLCRAVLLQIRAVLYSVGHVDRVRTEHCTPDCCTSLPQVMLRVWEQRRTQVRVSSMPVGNLALFWDARWKEQVPAPRRFGVLTSHFLRDVLCFPFVAKRTTVSLFQKKGFLINCLTLFINPTFLFVILKIFGNISL